jgi:hypothetical protein
MFTCKKYGWHCLYSSFHFQVIWLINEIFCITSFNSECFCSAEGKNILIFLHNRLSKDCFVNVSNRRERNLWVFIYQNHNFISNEWKNLHYHFFPSLSLSTVRKQFLRLYLFETWGKMRADCILSQYFITHLKTKNVKTWRRYCCCVKWVETSPFPLSNWMAEQKSYWFVGSKNFHFQQQLYST